MAPVREDPKFKSRFEEYPESRPEEYLRNRLEEYLRNKITYDLKGEVLLAHKPSGLSSHSPDGGKTPGMLELLEQKLQMELWPIHRLDKKTSGVLLFTTNKKLVEEAGIFMASAQKIKTYYALVHGTLNKKTIVRGDIVERGKRRFIDTKTPTPSPKGTTSIKIQTEVIPEKVLESDLQGSKQKFSLVRAFPRGGKTHQIRIHLASLGHPVVGDSLYGQDVDVGPLFLHAAQVDLFNQSYHSPFDEFRDFGRPLESLCGSLETEVLSRLSLWWKKEKPSFRMLSTRGLRYFHSASVALDWYNDVILIQPDEDKFSEENLSELNKFCEGTFRPSDILIQRPPKKRFATAQVSASKALDTTVEENGMIFRVKLGEGLMTGLFNDQRDNRKWVKEHSAGKKVLNLFSYTCSFGIAAALGGAKAVTNVDVSKNYLNWGKENHKLNNLEVTKDSFVVSDVRRFLKRCEKDKLLFDLIVLDPPSFSRSEEGVFQIKKDLGELIRRCDTITSKNGLILLSYNLSSLSESWIRSELKKNLRNFSNWQIKLRPTPQDFRCDPSASQVFLLSPLF